MGEWKVRGIRGAITAEDNAADKIHEATRELLMAMLERNRLDREDIASIIFTVTPDLDAAFPAPVAREIGLEHVPLLCATEIGVPGSVSKCIRILIHVNTTKGQRDMVHIYLRGATVLRPDLKAQ